MSAFVKYAGVLALGLATGSYLHGPPSLEGVGKLAWLDEVSNTIDEALAPAKPEAALAFVDAARAAIVDEELDYRIAQRINSVEGWRSFLATHGSGAYAAAASAEAETLLLAGEGPAQADAEDSVAEGSNVASPDAKAVSEVVASSAVPTIEGAALTQDEICGREREGAAQQPVSEEAARFANESGCEKLRPQLLGLIEGPDQPTSPPAAERPRHAVKIVSTVAPKWRAPMPPDKPRWTTPSHSLSLRRITKTCPLKQGACFWRGREELFAANRVGKNYKSRIKIAFW